MLDGKVEVEKQCSQLPGWVCGCSVLGEMLIVSAGVTSNAVENPTEKKNMLQNTYHCRFPRDHS